MYAVRRLHQIANVLQKPFNSFNIFRVDAVRMEMHNLVPSFPKPFKLAGELLAVNESES